MLQAANVDATLSRLKRQQALQEEEKMLAAEAATATEQAARAGQPMDPDFSPNRIGSGQFGNPEAEDRAAGAAQLASHMTQVNDFLQSSHSASGVELGKKLYMRLCGAY